MTVKEFCKKYSISQQAVYAKIKGKSVQLSGHVTKSGGQLVIDKYAEECLKPQCADFTLVRKIQNLQNQFDNKNTECENLKKSLSDEIAKNEKLQSQFAERDLKKSDFDNLADMLKNEILKISDKIDDIQNSISEITKKNSNGIIGVLKSCKFNSLNL